jgi:hypothetical protein
MKLEFLDATGNGEYPHASPKYLIRISDFTDAEQNKLIESIGNFQLSLDHSLELHNLLFVQTSNCFVTLQHSRENEGLIKTGEKDEFACLLSLAGFQEMVEIIKNIGSGYNWLTPGEYLDEPAFLISRYGTW